MSRGAVLWAALALVVGCDLAGSAPAPEGSTAAASVAPKSVVPAPEPPRVAPVPPKPATLLEFVRAAELGDANESVHPSALTIATWAKREGKMTVEELKAFRLGGKSTTIQIARRDADLVRGHTLCVDGPVVQIQGVSRDDVRIYGGVMTDAGTRQTVTFTTAEDVGDTAEGTRRAFCGIFIGRHTYKTLGGGSEIASSVVGMFLLPEKAPKPQPAVQAKPAPMPAEPAANCSPPYTLENGQRVLKVECM